MAKFSGIKKAKDGPALHFDMEGRKSICPICQKSQIHKTWYTWEEIFEKPNNWRSRFDEGAFQRRAWQVGDTWWFYCDECWEKQPFWRKALDAGQFGAKEAWQFARIRLWIRGLHALYYAIKHRTVDRYHIVKTGLPPGYCDIPERMLWACFALLVEFVEREKPFESSTCWGDCTENCSHIPEEGMTKKEKAAVLKGAARDRHDKSEILDLYNWWKNFDHDNWGRMRYSDRHKLLQKQLKRLIAVRERLWI